MEKRARFKSAWLPYALVAPQILVSILFFFWPAVQALYQSVLLQDAFGQCQTLAEQGGFRIYRAWRG